MTGIRSKTGSMIADADADRSGKNEKVVLDDKD
jgi:hypothetical protein